MQSRWKVVSGVQINISDHTVHVVKNIYWTINENRRKKFRRGARNMASINITRNYINIRGPKAAYSCQAIFFFLLILFRSLLYIS